MTTIKQLTEGFRSIAKNHIQINSFTADNFRSLGEAVINYPLMVVQDQGATINEDYVTHNFLVVILDRLEHDQSNMLNIQSECFSILNDVLLIMDNNEAFENLDVQFGSNATPVDYAKSNADNTAGYQIPISINVPRNSTGCVVYKCE
ncbi:MAG: hypothetical protein J0H29_13210 [Sphingobacteriales bacterium]|uniref:hypothetical protein n=1 Tax=uncultured Dysgonomonas sp. TaxID=206096 RepID=UPI00095B9E35|nr:hypothetical protein [uncultured Dysgonomonas sp.]MBN8859345.1 hypothetical protein [Sphingobacteriales bacterium]OJY86336.1 MAG: hypothetical protein BGP14_20390 [Sphingobacteriales bacterium 44-15]